MDLPFVTAASAAAGRCFTTTIDNNRYNRYYVIKIEKNSSIYRKINDENIPRNYQIVTY